MRQIVEFACKGVNMANVAVHVKNGRAAYSGLAYSQVPHVARVAPSTEYLITLRMGKPEQFPVTNQYPHRTLMARELSPAEQHAAALEWIERHPGLQAKEVEYYVSRGYRWGVAYVAPYGGMRSPVIRMADWREGLCGLAAHEAKHIHQFRHNRPRSEVECERFAAMRLEAFRTS